MYQLEIHRKLTSSLLRVSVQEEKEMFQDRMLMENQIKGLLSVTKVYEEDHVVYCYDINNLISLEQWAKERKLSYGKLILFFQQLFEQVTFSREYFLEEEGFLIEVSTVFLTETDQLMLCYCPQIHKQLRQSLQELIEFFMGTMDYQDQRAVKCVYQLYQLVRDEAKSSGSILEYLNRCQQEIRVVVSTNICEEEGTVSLQEDKQLGKSPAQGLLHHGEGISEQIVDQGQGEQIVLPYGEKHQFRGQAPYMNYLLCGVGSIALNGIMAALLLQSGVFHSKLGRQLDIMKLGLFLLICFVIEGYAFWKLVIMQEKTKKMEEMEAVKNRSTDYEDQVLVTEMPTHGEFPLVSHEPTYQLLPKERNTSQQITIGTYPYLLGKEVGKVDAYIDSLAVSRIHAKILRQERQLYLMDLGSTNGTYINKHKIMSQMEVPLYPGDEIRFADSIYELVLVS